MQIPSPTASSPHRPPRRRSSSRIAPACATCWPNWPAGRHGRAGGGPRRRRHRAQGKLTVRERLTQLPDADTPFLELSPLAAWDVYDNEAPAAGLLTAIARVSGREVVVVANDATVKGGTYYPAHRQEAPAGPGDRPGQPPALRLPRRLGRRVPAAAGGGLPGSRPLRPHLLQPGPPLGRTHPADCRRDGVVHGRRRLRSGDVGRDHHRAGHGHDLPRRPAPREGRHRRGRHRRGSRRRGRPHAALRRGGLSRRERRARAADRPHRRLDAAHGQAPARRHDDARSAPLRSARRSTASSTRTRGSRTTSAR